ncbi:hypothetical protein [Flavobacterium sp. N502540]|uniref:hypothetical protein n=1 Tax=Flavobacterium sp. N502540 TaxID=2986838 RepID=UPI00222486B0|nr:hypothetical protein [Flavobacterium sp. N502540]
MKNFIYVFILLLIASCGGIKTGNTAADVNNYTNKQLFALKGYQPIDPIAVNDRHVSLDSMIYYFPNEATRVAIGKLSENGSLAFGANAIARRGESYTIIIDYIKYHTTSIPARYGYSLDYAESNSNRREHLETLSGSIEFTKKYKEQIAAKDSIESENTTSLEVRIPIYVGVGLRIQSNVIVLKDSLNINLGSLYNLGIAASQNQINGTLIIQTLGISGRQISSAIPIPDKINESTVQNAIISLATIKSKLYDPETDIKPHVVGFGLLFNVEGGKDLIENTLQSAPPCNKGKEEEELGF